MRSPTAHIAVPGAASAPNRLPAFRGVPWTRHPVAERASASGRDELLRVLDRHPTAATFPLKGASPSRERSTACTPAVWTSRQRPPS